MEITKYPSGRESYDFIVSKRHFVQLLSAFISEDNKCGDWWLPTKDGKQLKLIVEEEIA